MVDNEGTEVAAKLEEALAGEAESATAGEVETFEATEVAEEGASQEGDRNNTIPMDRFRQVVSQKNDFKGQLENLQSQYETSNESLAKMTQMLEATKTDADLVKDIRALANDPDMLPHIEALDKRLKGIEDEIDDTGQADETTVDRARKVIEKRQTALEEHVADQYSDILAQRADMVAEKWLESLPEEYTEQDREVIGKLWANEVDWNSLEENPDNLENILASTFQTTIDSFGIPRGSLIDPNDPDDYEIEIEEPYVPTPEEELSSIIAGTDFGAFKSEDGKFEPEIDDADFASAMADVMKITGRNR
jgi:hypothetical protein